MHDGTNSVIFEQKQHPRVAFRIEKRGSARFIVNHPEVTMSRVVLTGCLAVLWTSSLFAAEPLARDEAAAALHRAVDFFSHEVSVEGGYLWRYSHDLARREGEGRATETTAWVQPPGTPTLGEAFLDAYELTGESYCLEAAHQTAKALVRGQLCSGGWDYRIEFSEKSRSRYAYFVDGCDRKARNVTTLDDNTTQAALRFLMRMDKTLKFKDAQIHKAALFALQSLLKAQYPNGAWPQRFTEPPDPALFPVTQAGYPDTWSRTHPNVDYKSFYTFNDNTIADMISTMIGAAETYGESRYLQSAKKAGEFILLAQMPEPQPAWAQQYNAQMQPAWARRFEPPSITGGESQGVLRILMSLYSQTGEKRFLEPIPRALAYLNNSLRPDGRLARFYELKTNRPLYFTKRYELTYSDDDMPTHYAFVLSSSLKTIEREYDRLRQTDPDRLNPTPRKPTYRRTSSLTSQAQDVVQRMDERGAWVEKGGLKYHGDDDPTTQVIDCRTFVANIRTLSRYLAASQ